MGVINFVAWFGSDIINFVSWTLVSVWAVTVLLRRV